MKITIVKEEVKSLNYLIVAYDVSKAKLNYFSKFKNQTGDICEIEGEVINRVKRLQDHFSELRSIATNNDYQGVCIACEPTGGYEKKILQMGRRYGFFTKYVSGEATSKAKVIESNDAGKNDKKDARVIHFLAEQGKTLTCNGRTAVYEQLKILNGHYEDLSNQGANLKTHISAIQEQLFPDLNLASKQLYSNVVSAVILLYGLNPYKIAKEKWNKFVKKTEKITDRKICGSGLEILAEIHNNAVANAFYIMDTAQSDEYEQELRFYYKCYQEVAHRKEYYKKQMTDIFKTTEEYGKLKEVPVSLFLMSRLIASTGSLANYTSIKQLMRFGGLNLQERQSGKFRGQIRLSKKGNVLMRKILGQIAFSCLIKTGKLYHSFYAGKKEKRGGFYALTCTMRKALKMINGVFKNKGEFCTERVFKQHVKLENVA
jgi:transposase